MTRGMDILNERISARTLPNPQILRGVGRIVPACRNREAASEQSRSLSAWATHPPALRSTLGVGEVRPDVERTTCIPSH